MSDHHLDVAGEPVDAIYPAHRRRLDEHHKQDGDAGPEHVQQRDQVHSALEDMRKPLIEPSRPPGTKHTHARPEFRQPRAIFILTSLGACCNTFSRP